MFQMTLTGGVTYSNQASNHFDVGFWFSHNDIFDRSDKTIPYVGTQQSLKAAYTGDATHNIGISGAQPKQLVGQHYMCVYIYLSVF